MRICVSGAGYVGLSNAVLLAQHNQVLVIDIVPAKVDMLNARKCLTKASVTVRDLATNAVIVITSTLPVG
jgi:UDPglucose 6-dehydrogenase